MRQVCRVIDQAAQMDPMRLRQILQDLEVADLLTLVGRIGDALGEKKKIGLAARIGDHEDPMMLYPGR